MGLLWKPAGAVCAPRGAVLVPIGAVFVPSMCGIMTGMPGWLACGWVLQLRTTSTVALLRIFASET